jgi:hypothetical protein
MNRAMRRAMALTTLSAAACGPPKVPSPVSSVVTTPEERYGAVVYAGDSSRVLYRGRRRGKESVSGFPDLTRLVVRDSAMWRAVWARLVAPDVRRPPPAAEPPPVDFARELVIVAAQGSVFCPSGITIDTVYRVGQSKIGVVVVRTQHALGGCGCLGYAAPAVALRLPLDQVEIIRFAERPPRDICDRRGP